MAYTPASRTAGLSLPSCSAAVAKRSFRVRVAALSASCPAARAAPPASYPAARAAPRMFCPVFFRCPGSVARRPKCCAASVPIRVRTLAMAAMIAAVTSGLISGTYYRSVCPDAAAMANDDAIFHRYRPPATAARGLLRADVATARRAFGWRCAGVAARAIRGS